jgi:hypothetical protein
VFSDFFMNEGIAGLPTGDTVELIVISGSSSSSDIPQSPPNTPIMMGEHVTLKDAGKLGYVPFYSPGTDSGDRNRWPVDAEGLTQNMKVVNTTHPITEGIQTDANGMVKILRDPFTNEDAYSKPPETVPPQSWKKNYEFAWPQVAASGKAPGLVILAVSPLKEDYVIFGVIDKGAMMADNNPATARLVHFFVNDNGSGGTMRRFLALNQTGRLLFLRAAQWAMGDPLTPWDVSEVGNWNLY